MHKYDGTTVKDKKNDQSICVNDAEEGEASSDVLYKLNIDVESPTMRKIENNQSSENVIHGKSDAISVNLSQFHDMSDNDMIASRSLNDEQGLVNFDSEGENNRRGELSFNRETYPTEEKEEQMYARARAPTIVPMTAPVTTTTAAVTTTTAAAVTTVTTKDDTPESEISHTEFKEFSRTDIMKDNTVPMVPMKSIDTMPTMPMKRLEMSSRLKNDRVKCIQTGPTSGNAGSSSWNPGSGSWTLRDNLMMKSNTGTGLLSPSKSNKYSTFAALSGWTLKKQFKNVFSSQSVSSTSPTTGTLHSHILSCPVFYCPVFSSLLLSCTTLSCPDLPCLSFPAKHCIDLTNLVLSCHIYVCVCVCVCVRMYACACVCLYVWVCE